jgi:acetyltransferase-like isoleucine patch superfamily enzyme
VSPGAAWPDLPPGALLGADPIVDDGVVLGYASGRRGVAATLVIGDGARLRSGTVLYAGSRVGARFETGHNVVVREQNEIGDDVSIWSGSVIDYGCRIGHRVKVHANVYVAQFSVLEDDVFLAPGVVLANDLYPGQIAAPPLVGPRLRRGAQIGVNATLRPAVEVGAGAIVGAGAVVVHDVPAGAVVAGNPARVIKRVADLDLGRWPPGA